MRNRYWSICSLFLLIEILAFAPPASASPQWDEVIWPSGTTLMTAHLDGSGSRILVQDTVNLWNPTVSRDGTRLAYQRSDPAGTQICMLDTSGTVCGAAPGYTYDLGWDVDNRTVYYTRNQGDGQIWSIDFDDPARVAVLLHDPAVYRSFGVCTSADGSRLIMVHDPSNWTYNNYLAAFDLGGGTENTIFPTNGRRDFFVDCSTTNSEITWVQMDSSDRGDIWRMNDDGTGAVNLTPWTENIHQQYPRFSPDGQQIFYVESGYLWVMERDGSQKTSLFFLADPDPKFDIARIAADPDTDGDGVADVDDNCPLDSNPSQSDSELDGIGDACDVDDDNDGELDLDDNCQFTPNPGQIDLDNDGLGDACDSDVDGDGVCDDPSIQVGCTGGPDNCPTDPNAFQTDTDADLDGDECDLDDDNDGVCDTADAVEGVCDAGPDNCPTLANPGQADVPDGDGIGDLCDADDDNDGADDGDDNCPATANADQNDNDLDGDGDACDPDDDNDGVLDGDDNCQFVSNGGQGDTDSDGVGNACNDDDDADGDEWSDSVDNCPDDPNSDQNDLDGDGEGDACDPDIDGDGVSNDPDVDVCPGTPLGELVNPANGCTIAQLCPCDGPRGTNVLWKNHGKYVSCVAHATNDFVAAGLITGEEKGAIMSAAGQSDCGRKN